MELIFLEKYKVNGDSIEKELVIDESENVYILRPIEVGGCQFIYQRGGYDTTSFGGFTTNIMIKDIAL